MAPKAKEVDPRVLTKLIRADENGGVEVRYWPIWNPKCQEEFTDGKTRSQPWMLGGGQWVVNLEGHAGSVAVSHMALLPIDGEQGPAYGRQ